jgi:peptide/nickel transport system ATP-binding protein
VFSGPQHEKTRRAIDAAQALDKTPRAPVDSDIALSAEGMRVVYRERGEAPLVAVDDVSLLLRRGETLAVVGESGSGKTSLSRAILGLVEPEAGSVLLSGEPVAASLGDRDRATRRRLQLVFQEPAASLSPSMTVSALLEEQLMLGGADARERHDAVPGALRRMGLGPELLERFPHELSGGQAQRVAIARALLARPDVLICDEAVASLDGDTRARILARLETIQAEDGLSILFISHDLTVVGSMAHRVAVMHGGRFIESGLGA